MIELGSPAVAEIGSFQQLRSDARAIGPMRVAIVCADDDIALRAAADALVSGIVIPQFFGDAAKIRARVRALGLGSLASAQIFDAPDPMQAAVAACTMAACLDMPRSCSSLATSTIRIPCLLIKPISVTRPTSV